MISPRLRLQPSAADLVAGFNRIRDHMNLPEDFPEHVTQEAGRVALRSPSEGPVRSVQLDLEFLTIDPPGSKDLDQALHCSKGEHGFKVHYAIADVGHFVDPGSALEKEAAARGKTLYCPDIRIPLYPPVISEGAASLLPGQIRPAILWSFELDSDGVVRSAEVERAVVRSSRQMSYREAQEELEGGSGAWESLRVLREIGPLRQRLEEQRGGVDLHLTDQEVSRTKTGFKLEYRAELAIEGWNAQLSLMTGMAAAKMMLNARVGLLRTLPPPPDEVVQRLRRSAEGLGLEWEDQITYQHFIRRLNPAKPRAAAFLSAARTIFRGSSYTFFDATLPEHPAHHAIAAPYAHVTAPLRRMADRLTNELVLRLSKRPNLPEWLLDRLEEVPEAMKHADSRDRELESRIVDYVEAMMLQARVGQTFEGLIVESGAHGGLVQLKDPAVLGACKGVSLPLGHHMEVRLAKADPESSRIEFIPA